MKMYTKLLVLALGLVLVAGCGEKKTDEAGDKGIDEKSAVSEKVKLDFHIMSKCPFGVKVVQALMPVMEKMGDNIDLNIEYIGREKDGELTSMHGEPEVQGDMLQLCARKLGDEAVSDALGSLAIRSNRTVPLDEIIELGVPKFFQDALLHLLQAGFPEAHDAETPES